MLLLRITLIFAVLNSTFGTEPAMAVTTQCGYAKSLDLRWWAGHWQGYEAGAHVADEKNILSQCVLREEFKASDGTSGHALIEMNGSRLTQPYFSEVPKGLPTSGGVLTAHTAQRFSFLRGDGALKQSRITWERIGPAAGRQLLELSDDAGKTWRTKFELFLFKTR